MPYFPPASTGGGNDSRLTVARKTSDQAFTGAATNVTDMALTLAESSTYYVYITIPVTTVSGTSPTLTIRFTGPASTNLVSLRRTQMTSVNATATSVITAFPGNFASGAAVANTHHTVEGMISTSAGNGGTLQLQITAGGVTPSITVPAGASMYAIKVS